MGHPPRQRPRISTCPNSKSMVHRRNIRLKTFQTILLLTLATFIQSAAQTNFCPELAKHFRPPAEFSNTGKYATLLTFQNGQPVRNAADWQRRRAEIKSTWEKFLGEWPPLLANNRVRVLETTNRENFIQKKIEITVANNLTN